MQRRAFERVPANIEVKFFCCESHYDGTIMNLSQGGMYISTDEMRFPFDSEIDIIIPVNLDILKVPVKVFPPLVLKLVIAISPSPNGKVL